MPLREQVIADYEILEPDGQDSWNPVATDTQLGYRMALLGGLGRALRISGVDLTRLNVVDIGCGNGRSTRSYLEFGLRPWQLCGLDFRAGAIALARQMHPTIRYEIQAGVSLPFDDKSVEWVSLCMVISSIRAEDRRLLAAEIQRVLKPQGFFFYFDHLFGAEFCGHDRLQPDSDFAPLRCRWNRQLKLSEILPNADMSPWEPVAGLRRRGWRFGRGGGLLSWIPRPDGLGAAVKARLPSEVSRWLSGRYPAFDIRLYEV